MALPVRARILTRIIGDELVSLISSDATVTSDIAPKVVQFGMVIRQASIEHLKQYLPAIFVKPEETIFQQEGADVSGTDYRVTESFRICHLYDFKDNTIAVPDKASDDMDLIVRALRTDHKLSNIAGSSIQGDGGKHQIVHSEPRGVDWEPEEDILFAEAGLAIKVEVLRWEVQWLAR